MGEMGAFFYQKAHQKVGDRPLQVVAAEKVAGAKLRR